MSQLHRYTYEYGSSYAVFNIFDSEFHFYQPHHATSTLSCFSAKRYSPTTVSFSVEIDNVHVFNTVVIEKYKRYIPNCNFNRE